MDLAAENAALKAEVARLRAAVANYEATTSAGAMTTAVAAEPEHRTEVKVEADATAQSWRGQPLAHIQRYSRQMLLADFGPAAQEKLCSKKALCIGAGGLGSSVCLYLGAAGVGRLGIVDHDDVDASNLHRQVIHPTDRVGVSKAVSAAQSVKAVNPLVDVVPIVEAFTADNALRLVADYDVVIDATDNVGTRYLINDACVLTGKPLVFGAALGFEGQMTVYNYAGGPCYRCMNPVAPPAQESCSDMGVLGPVPGFIGCLQAIEAIKVLAGVGSVMSARMLHYDGLDGRFRTFNTRARQLSCAVCGAEPTIKSMQDSLSFCACASVRMEEEAERAVESGSVPNVTCAEYKHILDSGVSHVLLDVRKPAQFGMCHFPTAINVPLKDLLASSDSLPAMLCSSPAQPIYVMCRRGIDSVTATQFLATRGISQVFNVQGGLSEWHRKVDKSFPSY